jgi:hypothetical protein
MTNGGDRLDRIEDILERVGKRLEEMAARQQYHDESLNKVNASLEYMAVRQQYHDEAFERHDAEMKALGAAMGIDAENIRALARIADVHNRRLEDFEGGEPS